MMRFPLAALRRATASPLADALVQRATFARDELHRKHPHHTSCETGRAVEILKQAYHDAATSGPAEALRLVEAGTESCVNQLRAAPRAVQMSLPVQRTLRTAYANLVAHRVLTQRFNELIEEPWKPADGSSPPTDTKMVLEMSSDGLGAMLADALEDASAFCREKQGDSPEVVLIKHAASVSSDMLLMPSYIAFSVFEIVKNAQGAHVRRAGADRLDDLPPIRVTYGASEDGWGFVQVEDHGGGMADPFACTRFLYTSTAEKEVQWNYSRNFGSTFEGLGMGLALAHTHVAFLGGSLSLASSTDHSGAIGRLTFDVTGERSDPLPPSSWPQPST